MMAHAMVIYQANVSLKSLSLHYTLEMCELLIYTNFLDVNHVWLAALREYLNPILFHFHLTVYRFRNVLFYKFNELSAAAV